MLNPTFVVLICQVALKELKTLHEAVLRNKDDIHEAEKMTTKNLEHANEIR